MEYRDLDVDGPVGNEVGRRPTACEQCNRIGARGYLVGHDDGRCEIELVCDVHREVGNHRAVSIVPNQVLCSPAVVPEGSAEVPNRYLVPSVLNHHGHISSGAWIEYRSWVG